MADTLARRPIGGETVRDYAELLMQEAKRLTRLVGKGVALELLLSKDVRELIVVDDDGHITGFLDEAEITKTYHGQTAIAPT